VLPAETDGYVFPVYGQVSYGDDYGAPRAVTEWHHGNDLFATEGTPVLAVADGTLFNVGVNTLGGNRLWLRDGRGNTFYYAHLSAYAPVAAEGAQVRAGEVIGFVGHTGQAITTPPHLHFEIHPGGGDSVNPYPYLLAWQRRTDVALAFRAAAVAHGQAPAAGVLVIGYTPPSQQVAPDGEGLAEAAP
jgi:murein DD-endopeptidase MepM/ murein hydrolase activator NlpD